MGVIGPAQLVMEARCQSCGLRLFMYERQGRAAIVYVTPAGAPPEYWCYRLVALSSPDGFWALWRALPELAKGVH